MKENILGVNEELKVAGKRHPIVFGQPESPLAGYQVKPYSFISGLLEGVADGCMFLIEANQSTRTVLVAKDASFQDAPLKGSGWFHAVDPEGKVVTFEFKKDDTSKMVEYGKGWLITWIAASEGIEVVSLNQPPFTDGMETPVEVGASRVEDKVIPIDYWIRYAQLKRPQT